jgi:hypothetical protein
LDLIEFADGKQRVSVTKAVATHFQSMLVREIIRVTCVSEIGNKKKERLIANLRILLPTLPHGF